MSLQWPYVGMVLLLAAANQRLVSEGLWQSAGDAKTVELLLKGWLVM